MKYSNYVGGIAAIVLIACCYIPWIYIESIKTTITGISTEHTNFGKPGLLHIIFAFLTVILFLIPAVWAKTINVFITTLNLAWSLRNFLLIPQCEQGECPTKLPGIYLVVLVSVLMFVMALLPKVRVKNQKAL